MYGSPSKVKARTFRATFRYPIADKGQRSKKRKPPRFYRNPLPLAQAWQKALERGDYSSAVDLAHNLGVSRARVSQLLRLLQLSPEVIKTIVALGDPQPALMVTERRLRPLIGLAATEQMQKIKAMITTKAVEDGCISST
jgi:hypothetical protein